MSLADDFVWATIAVVATAFVIHATGLRQPVARGLRAFAEGLRGVRIGQVTAAVGLMVLILACLNRDVIRSGLPLLLAAVVGVGLFALAWFREFLFLMSLRDDDLPGRFDKPIWAALLIGLAPVGLFVFRAYRLSRWPEVKPAADAARELA